MSDQTLTDTWNQYVLPHFPSGAGCACSGACNELGFCPLTGKLVAVTPKQAESIRLQDQEILEALRWWKAIKSKRSQAGGVSSAESTSNKHGG